MDEKLFNARKEAGLTQEALAKKMKVSASTISSWETGKTEPTEKEIDKLEKILDTNLVDTRLTTSIMDVFKILYVLILIIIPGIYFIGQCSIELKGFYIVGSELDNISEDMVNTYSNAIMQKFLIMYGWYAISNIANYVFYKMKHVKAIEVVLIIETIIFALSIVFISHGDSYLDPMLLLIPILTGVFEYAFIKREQ